MYKLEGVKDENIIMDMEIKKLDQGLIQERSRVIIPLIKYCNYFFLSSKKEKKS